jgi:hypothetical protein
MMNKQYKVKSSTGENMQSKDSVRAGDKAQ